MSGVCPNCKGEGWVMKWNPDTREEKQVWCSWCHGWGRREVTVGGYPVKED